jgi:hypothetical protein
MVFHLFMYLKKIDLFILKLNFNEEKYIIKNFIIMEFIRIILES